MIYIMIGLSFTPVHGLLVRPKGKKAYTSPARKKYQYNHEYRFFMKADL
jgi:hypothetical protein